MGTDKLWHSRTDIEQGREGGKKGKLPSHVIRNIARASTAGGTAFCDFCGHRFSANYVKSFSVFGKGIMFACRDCAKARNLK